MGDAVDGAMKVGAHAVHLVHVADAGDIVAVRLPPNGLGLRLDSRNGVEHDHAAIEDAQAALHLSGEVHVARRVDDVYGVVFPGAGGRRGRYGDTALALLGHPVHNGGAFIHTAQLVDTACGEEDALGHGGLARVDVRDEADVARVGEPRLGGFAGITLSHGCCLHPSYHR